MKGKGIIWAVLVWGLLWTGSLGVYQEQRLKKPLVLAHYVYAQQGEDQYKLSLFYVTNRSDQTKLTAIRLPGQADEWITYEKHAARSENAYVLLNETYVEIPIESKPHESVTHITAFFSDGSEQDVDIGELLFVSKLATSGILEPSNSNSYTNTTGRKYFVVKENVRLTNISVLPAGLSPNELGVTINGKEWSSASGSIELKKGFGMRLDYVLTLPDQDHRLGAYIQPALMLEFEKEDGSIVRERTDVLFTPFWDEETLSRIVRERGERR
ncbi:MAG: hypothetical protein ACM32O_18445 [Clostridia bacterium]